MRKTRTGEERKRRRFVLPGGRLGESLVSQRQPRPPHPAAISYRITSTQTMISPLPEYLSDIELVVMMIEEALGDDTGRRDGRACPWKVYSRKAIEEVSSNEPLTEL
jgi:hypothetical protein